ncbi:prolipoprotein diacylglyceryl transferase [Patescibacteria group bacterium]|nr:prolipoprotein diacylglyceryl transferase [Patescibacteria group bacterium]
MNFPFPRPYGIIILTAILSGYIIFSRRLKSASTNVSSVQKETLFIITLVCGLLGARLYHLLTDYHLYLDNWQEAFYIWHGGLGILGGLAGGGMSVWLYASRQKISIKLLLDAAAPAFLWGQAFGRLANITNGELLPFAYYDAGANFLLFLSLLVIERKFHLKTGTGKTFGGFALLYGLGRLVTEQMRSPRLIILSLGLIKLSFTELACLILAGTGLYHLRRQKPKPYLEPH